MNSDKYPWKYALNFAFDILIFMAVLAILLKPVLTGLSSMSAGDFALIGTVVISLCMVIEHREKVVYQGPHYQSILSNSFQATGLNTMASLRYKASQSAFYFMLLGTVIAGAGGIKL